MRTNAISRDVPPLVFLLARTVVNGVKRAVSSPKRLIGLLFSSLWLVNLVFQPFGMGRRSRTMPVAIPSVELPSPALIESFVFAGFGTLSLIYLMGVLSYRGAFKPADVDVLFPTPISPKVVLTFRIVRDYLLSLLLPIVVGLIGFGGGNAKDVGGLLRNAPPSVAYLPRAIVLGVLLLSLFWVTLGYTVSIVTDRNDNDATSFRKRIVWGIAAIITAVFLVFIIHIRMDPTVVGLRAATTDPVLRLLLLPATAATEMVMAPLTGSAWQAALGFFGLLACSAFAFRGALAQSDFLYDSAAAKGFDQIQMRDLSRKGDQIGVLVEQAKRGKIKKGRIATRVSRYEVTGGLALVWRELIVQTRGQQALFYIMGAIGGLGVGGLMWAIRTSTRASSIAPTMYLFAVGMAIYIVVMATALQGFVEFLRKVDVAKPLPFTPTATVFYEVAGKLPGALVITVVSAIVGTAILPAVWSIALASLVIGPVLALVMISTIMLVSVLFPDFEDPTQRGFRGLMTLVGLLIGVGPVVGIIAGTALLKWPLWTSTLPVAIVGLGIALLCCLGAGRLYADFNPSE